MTKEQHCRWRFLRYSDGAQTFRPMEFSVPPTSSPVRSAQAPYKLTVGLNVAPELVEALSLKLSDDMHLPNDLVEFFVFSCGYDQRKREFAEGSNANIHQELTNTLCLCGQQREHASTTAHALIQDAMSPRNFNVEIVCHKQPIGFSGDEEYCHELLALC